MSSSIAKTATATEHSNSKCPEKTSKNDSQKKAVKGKEEEVEEEDEFKDCCFICANPVKIWAVGPCNHRTCYLCNLRLRALYETKSCPYCKDEIEVIIYTKDPDATYQELSQKKFKFRDQKLAINCDGADVYSQIRRDLEFRCPHRKCDYVDEKDWDGLKQHTQDAHGMFLCDLCIKYKMAFPFEHRLFTKNKLRHHKREGDGIGFTGHPKCDFCHTCFYSGDELFTHCRERHEQCFICIRNGTGQQVYFKNYIKLMAHFTEEHYVCKHPECLEKKFIAFATEMDLKAHMIEEHSSQIVGQKAKLEAKKVNVQFASSSRQPSQRNGSDREENQRQKRDGQSTTSSKKGPSKAGGKRPVGFGQLSQPEPPAQQQQQQQQPEPNHHSRPAGIPSTSAGSYRQRVADETEWPSLSSGGDNGTTTLSPTPSSIRLSSTTAGNPGPDAALEDYKSLLKNVSTYFSHREPPVERFKNLTGSFIEGNVPPDDYISNCWLLFLTAPKKEPKAIFSKVVKQVVDQIDDSDRKKALLTAYNNHKARQQQFPDLMPSGSPQIHGKPATPLTSVRTPRVLVIKAKPATPGLPTNAHWGSGKGRGSDSHKAVGSLSRNSSSSDFPSLVSPSRPTSAATAPSVSSRYQQPGPKKKGAELSKSEFPELGPRARPKIPPVNPILPPGTWVAPGSANTPGPKKGNTGTQKGKKGKKTLLYIG
ncbi:hypothetical protein H4219_001541 [Mycoemilia scoparia]|uniref:RING-type E3 ubiquitin transferase n=1 Tax=Mycoemilia scoparia TaxID=417184 RepID=A0A9W8A3C8_9FUNG|nr:hypothetical protein H4219_001541 [Mycoemilia scoparia]